MRRVFEYYCYWLEHPRTQLDPKRIELIGTRLRTFSPDDLCKAIKGCERSDFHMGRDPKTQGQRHDRIEVIFRDVAHVEMFMGLADSGPPPRRFGSAQPDAGLTGWEGAEIHGSAE